MELRKIFTGVVGLCLSIFIFFGFASAEELTITTYYPSPYGAYNELSANSLLVNPQPESSIPASANEGTVVYNLTEHALQYWNGTEWMQMMSSANELLGTFTKSSDQSLGDYGSGNWQNIITWSASGTYASIHDSLLGKLQIDLTAFHSKGLYLIEWTGDVWVRDLTTAKEEWIQCRLRTQGCGGDWSTIDVTEEISDPAVGTTGTTVRVDRSVSLYLGARNCQRFLIEARKSHRETSKIRGRINMGFIVKVTRLTSL